MRLNFYKILLSLLLASAVSLGAQSAFAQNAAQGTESGTQGSGNNSHLLLEDDTRVYPNPTMGEVKIQLPDDGIGIKNLEIYNTIGRRITSDYNFSYEGRTIRLDLTGLTSGIYFVRFRAEGKTQMHRVVLK